MQNEKEIYMKYLLSGTVAPWISTSFPIIQTVLLVLIALCSVVIIVAVLMHPSDPDGGNNAITGVRDSYYMQNRGMTKEGILNKLITISSIIVLVLSVAYFITLIFFPSPYTLIFPVKSIAFETIYVPVGI